MGGSSRESLILRCNIRSDAGVSGTVLQNKVFFRNRKRMDIMMVGGDTDHGRSSDGNQDMIASFTGDH